MMRFGTCLKGVSTLLSKIFHLAFNGPKALSITIYVLDWIKFQCVFLCDNSLKFRVQSDTKSKVEHGTLYHQLVYKT
jgi:hypothetical protein